MQLLLIFPLPLEESDLDLLISYVNQSLMIASCGTKELNGFSFGITAPKGLQPKVYESIMHLVPGQMGCCIHHKADLDCFVKVIHKTLRKDGLLMK